MYAFADESGEDLSTWAGWFASASGPISRHTPAGADADAVFDAKVIYPRRYEEVEMAAVSAVFRPHSGPLGLMDWEKVYATGPSTWTDADIFAERGISARGAVVVVRPDQYVAAVLPLTATAELGEFLAGAVRPAG